MIIASCISRISGLDSYFLTHELFKLDNLKGLNKEIYEPYDTSKDDKGYRAALEYLSIDKEGVKIVRDSLTNALSYISSDSSYEWWSREKDLYVYIGKS